MQIELSEEQTKNLNIFLSRVNLRATEVGPFVDLCKVFGFDEPKQTTETQPEE